MFISKRSKPAWAQHPPVWLAIILVVSLLLRVWLCFFAGLEWLTLDSTDGYFVQAKAFGTEQYSAYFPPGYPLVLWLLSPLEALLGQKGVALGLNLAAAAGSIVLIWKILKFQHYPLVWVVTGTAIFAFLPLQLNQARYALTEPLTAFYLLFAGYLLLRERFMAAGWWLGIAAITRSEPLAVLLALAVVVGWRAGLRPGLRLAGVGLAVVLAGSWLNAVHIGSWALSQNTAANIAVAAVSSGPNLDFELRSLPQPVHNTTDAVALYLRQARETPGQFWLSRWLSFWEMWGITRSDNAFAPDYTKRSPAAAGIVGLHLGLFVLAFLVNYRKYDNIIFLTVLTVFTLVHFFLFSEPRHSVPVEAFALVPGLSACANGLAAAGKWLPKG